MFRSGDVKRTTSRLRDPEIAALFTNDNPEEIFSDLREIGHGNFGAVYCARNVQTKEIVAIKKMTFQGKQSSEKWQDIVREVKFMQLVKHRNCVEYKGCYLRDHTAWLVMEYCLGSAADILEVHKQPLQEEEIGAICYEVLHGLEYIHNQGFIHRDIKAGNILLTDSAAVKLADFGSASIVSPANSFVGTPHWMAPEVILAMDEGNYSGKADIWSLGITSIELAERKPPLFNMNAMSALYHIGQNEAPRLAPSGDWSDDFRLFVSACLTKDPEQRPDVTECLKDAFVVKLRPVTILRDLVERTKVAAREHDNAVARRFERMMIAIAGLESGVDISESTLSLNTTDSLTIESTGSDTGSVDSHSSIQNGGDSVTRNRSDDQLSGTTGSSKSGNSSNDIVNFGAAIQNPSVSSGDDLLDAKQVKMRPLVPNNFATIRTSTIVNKQQREHELDHIRDQMSGYKQMRRQHQKVFRQTENRLHAEMEDLKQRLEKEYEALQSAYAAQLRALEQRHERDKETHRRNAAADEAKTQRTLQLAHEAEIKQLQTLQKKDYARMKDGIRRGVLGDVAVGKESIRMQKDSFKMQQAKVVQQTTDRHRKQLDTELRIVQRRNLLRELELERTQSEEVISRLREQSEGLRNIQLRHDDLIRELEQRHQVELHRLRREQTAEQQRVEHSNQREYTERTLNELRLRHAAEVKQVPKDKKAFDQTIRRKIQESVKAQERQYRAQREQITIRLPKSEQRNVLKKLKDEHMRNLAMLAEQYQNTVAEHVEMQSSNLNASQTAEVAELRQRLQKEQEMLADSQKKHNQQLTLQLQREQKELEQKIQIRRNKLEETLAKERENYERNVETRRSDLKRRQTSRLQDFDLLTATSGLELERIVEATEPSTNTPGGGGSTSNNANRPASSAVRRELSSASNREAMSSSSTVSRSELNLSTLPLNRAATLQPGAALPSSLKDSTSFSSRSEMNLAAMSSATMPRPGAVKKEPMAGRRPPEPPAKTKTDELPSTRL